MTVFAPALQAEVASHLGAQLTNRCGDPGRIERFNKAVNPNMNSLSEEFGKDIEWRVSREGLLSVRLTRIFPEETPLYFVAAATEVPFLPGQEGARRMQQLFQLSADERNLLLGNREFRSDDEVSRAIAGLEGPRLLHARDLVVKVAQHLGLVSTDVEVVVVRETQWSYRPALRPPFAMGYDEDHLEFRAEFRGNRLRSDIAGRLVDNLRQTILFDQLVNQRLFEVAELFADYVSVDVERVSPYGGYYSLNDSSGNNIFTLSMRAVDFPDIVSPSKLVILTDTDIGKRAVEGALNDLRISAKWTETTLPVKRRFETEIGDIPSLQAIISESNRRAMAALTMDFPRKGDVLEYLI